MKTQILILGLTTALSAQAFFNPDPDASQVNITRSGNGYQIDTRDANNRPRLQGSVNCSFGRCSGSAYDYETDTYRNYNIDQNRSNRNNNYGGY